MNYLANATRRFSAPIPSKPVSIAIWLVLIAGGTGTISVAQTSDPPFTVSNPKHKNWPADEAQRIYFAACERVAKAIRPENPPKLLPKFVLILGTDSNEVVRVGETAEIRLKNWNPGAFSDAVVVMAARAILDSRQLAGLSRDVLLSSHASVSVGDLKNGQ